MNIEYDSGSTPDRSTAEPVSGTVFNAFYNDQTPRLLRTALNFGAPEVYDAEDIVQMGWERRLRNTDRIHTNEAGYLSSIVINLTRDLLRHTTRAQRVGDTPSSRDVSESPATRVVFTSGATDMSAEERALLSLEVQRTFELIGELPRQQRKIMLLRALDIPEADIAEILHISVGTVKNQTNRARTKLKAQLAIEE